MDSSYLKDVAIVFTADSVPIPEEAGKCYYPFHYLGMDLNLLTGTPFEHAFVKWGCCIRPWVLVSNTNSSYTNSSDPVLVDTPVSDLDMDLNPELNTTTVPSTNGTTTRSTTSISGGGGGDPHFKTWSGKYDFHGECDLVLLDNPGFANGMGMSIHIRTKRERFFSEIATAAIRIGPDTLEFSSVDQWWLNGKPAPAQRNTISGYSIFRFPKAISVRLDDTAEYKAKIDLIMRNNGML